MTVKVNLGGIAYDAAPEVANALAAERQRADAAEKQNEDAKRTIEDMQKEYDALKGKMDALEAEMKEFKASNNDEAIATAAKERMALISRASLLVNADELVDFTPRQIMEKAIQSRNDGLDLASKSDDYVAARFDSLVESVSIERGNTQKQAAQMGPRADASAGPKDHREDAADSLRNMWKGKGK